VVRYDGVCSKENEAEFAIERDKERFAGAVMVICTSGLQILALRKLKMDKFKIGKTRGVKRISG
jgi:hypothetical protein